MVILPGRQSFPGTVGRLYLLSGPSQAWCYLGLQANHFQKKHHSL